MNLYGNTNVNPSECYIYDITEEPGTYYKESSSENLISLLVEEIIG